ncbi:MAG: response regulator [Planctomycetes bacterium]|nr:response regulator [Planctomycetota bacterium]
MAKLLIPAFLESEFAAQECPGGFETETVDNLASALQRMADASADAVFTGAGSPLVERAVYQAAIASFSGFEQPVLVLSAGARLVWANRHAEKEGFSLDAAPRGDIAGLLNPNSRHSLRRSLSRCLEQRIVVRTIVLRNQASYEVNIMPAVAAGGPLAAAFFNKKDVGAGLYERVERLAHLASNLLPEDADALVRLSNNERVALIRRLIEKTVQETFEYDDFILRTVDEKTGVLEPVLACSGTGARLSKRVFEVGTEGGSVAGYVAATGKPYLVEDAPAEPRWITDIEHIQSAVVVPLKIASKVVGTFAIEKREKFAFDYYDLILATVFAGYITAALDVADLVGLGQSVLVDRVVESAAEEVSVHLKNISESIEDLRRYNISDSITVTSRLESISASASTIQDAILKGARRAGAAVAPPKALPDEILADKHILIADDEPSILQSLGAILRSSGCRVDLAHDGQEAVEMATETHYDLVISDIKMPRMTGYEVYNSIKAEFPDTSVILMTAYGYDPTHSIVRARQEGLEGVLYKPFRAETLKKALRQALQKKEAAQ